MVAARTRSTVHGQGGTTLIEVLVTLVIIAIGLLGLAQLQVRVQASEMDAYQRAQALLLLNDMVSRINTNRAEAAQYVTGLAALGADMTCPTDVSTRRATDLTEWCNALQGAGETSGGNRVGALIGGRGCIESLGGTEYLVTVAWQGLSPIAALPDSVACGENEYDGADGSNCVGDLCRRAVTARILVGAL